MNNIDIICVNEYENNLQRCNDGIKFSNERLLCNQNTFSKNN